MGHLNHSQPLNIYGKKKDIICSLISNLSIEASTVSVFLDKFVASIDPMIIISQQKSDGGDGSGCLYLDW